VIELSDLIRDLRYELSDAMAAAPESGLRFRLGAIELEAAVHAERVAGGDARIRFVVLEAGAEIRSTRITNQLVKLTLVPEAVGGSGDVFVRGASGPNER
jgi:hypothetical protein